MKKVKQVNGSLPMTVDDFVLLDNKEDRDEPTELLDICQRSPQYISTLQREVRSNPKLLKLNSRFWQVELGKDFVLGQIGEKIEAFPQKMTKYDIKESNPKVPSWSGINYHPKLSGPPVIRSFRRTKGKRVIPHYIFHSPDQRQVYIPNGYPWRCIGKIFVWNNASSPDPVESGTGVLVGRNIVVTASHMCPWRNAGSWMMKFVPAFYDGKSLLGGGVYSFVQTCKGYKDHDQGDDMAVLKLYTPLGDTLGWFGYKTYSDSWEDGLHWTKCGYPGVVAGGRRPSRITWFPIIDDDSEGAGVELEYRVDSSEGDSGGPVFGWWGGMPYLIGTHSGSEEELDWFSVVQNNVAAGGIALSNLIGWARDNW